MTNPSEVGPAAMEMIHGLNGRLKAKEEECQRLRDLYAVSEATLASNLKDARTQQARMNEAVSAKNTAYRERTYLIAALAKLFPASIEIDPKAEFEWRYVVIIDLPTGQASWHIPADEVIYFACYHNAGRVWDGHTTDEKYRRLAALPTIVSGRI